MTNLDLEITFRKSGALRFVSHLDLLRMFDQTARRTGLPVKFTQGFNPKVKLSSARALPLGAESECEVLVVGFVEAVEPERVKEAFNAELPDELKVMVVGPPGPLARGADVIEQWDVLFEDAASVPEGGVIARVLARESLPVTRKKKNGKERSLDIRPMILEVRNESDRLALVLRSVDRRHARIGEILEALVECGAPEAKVFKVIKRYQRPAAEVDREEGM